MTMLDGRWAAAPRPAPRRVALAFSLALALLSCSREPGRSGPKSPPPDVRFADVTARAGIARETATYDASIADIDGDGRLDIYVGNHGTGAVLLRNQGDGTFRDILPGSGLDPKGDQHGAGFGDFDSDGAVDLYVSVGANRGLGVKSNRLYRNEGGAFVDVVDTAEAGDPRGRSRSVAWIDVDVDGALDLLLANFASPSRLYRNLGNGVFADRSADSGIEALPATRVAWTDYDGDLAPDILLGGTPRGLRLLRNEGDFRFRDVTDEVGLSRIKESVMGMSFGDYDGDGNPDLALSHGYDFSEGVVADESGELRFAFFAHDEPAGFDFDAPADAGPAFALYENGSPSRPESIRCGNATPATADPVLCDPARSVEQASAETTNAFLLWRDGGGRADCAGCPSVARWHLRWRGAGDHHLSGIVRGGRRPEPVGLRTTTPRGASIWRNEGNRFELAFEVGRGLPPEAAVNGQAVQWFDVDNDGWLDLYLVDSGVDGRGSRNVLLLNDEGTGFSAAPLDSGASPGSGGGRGVGAHPFDFDGDGRLDLFLTNGWGAPPFDRGPYRLLHNETPGGHWLGVRLRGRDGRPRGTGSRVAIEACGIRRRGYDNGGPNYFSQSAVPLHFGLGACGRVTSLEVQWPSGRRRVLRDPKVDVMLDIEEES